MPELTLLKNKPRFSVIIPAHNAADRITKLLDTIRDQSFQDYELIVVCDACEDNTADIARRYTKSVYEVNFHHDGLTRNYGLDHAWGEWVLFADDDDWFLHELVFEMLNSQVGRQGEDVLMFSFIWKGVGYTRNVPRQWIAVWNKCWRRAFIGDTRFSDVPYSSDADFHREMMQKGPKLANWDTPMYYYNFLREGSLTKELKDKGVLYQEIDYEKAERSMNHE